MIDSHQYFTMISSGSNGSLGNKPSPAQHGNPNESSDFNYANALTVDRHRQRHIMPKHKSRAERSVRLMHVSSGGQSTGKIMNRWGKTDKSERLLGRRSGSRLSAQSRAGKSTNNFKWFLSSKRTKKMYISHNIMSRCTSSNEFWRWKLLGELLGTENECYYFW